MNLFVTINLILIFVLMQEFISRNLIVVLTQKFKKNNDCVKKYLLEYEKQTL